jgi:uncharacterized protein (TIGR02996 family)
MTRDEAFLQTICENPDDDVPRLVYADWLEEHGDADRAEFIRVQIELAKMDRGDPRRSALAVREAELLRAGEAAWRKEWPAPVGFTWGSLRRGFPEAMVLDLEASRGVDYGEYFQGVLNFARAQPDTVLALSRAFIGVGAGHNNVHVAALAHLPERDWPALIGHALAALAGGKRNGSAEDVIEEAAWQCPDALRAHLHSLDWDDAPEAFEDAHTRITSALQRLEGGATQPLGPRPAWHIGFPPDYFDEKEMRPWLRHVHPTWAVPRDGEPLMAFGGAGTSACFFCHGTLHHILTLDPVPEGLGVTGLRRLSLQVCLSCLGWEEVHMFYAHGPDGSPRSMHGDGTVSPQFPARPLRPAQVCLRPTERRWLRQRWGGGSEPNLNRVGGLGTWVQSPTYPPCPSCKRRMNLLMQLDSNLPLDGGQGEWLWGSGGLGYSFWCNRCRVSAWLWQCT